MSSILLSTRSFFLAGWVKWAILSHFYYYHFFTDKLLLEHVGLPHVLDLAVLLVLLDESMGSFWATFTFSTFLPEHSFMLKSLWFDFSVSPSPLVLTLGLWTSGLRTRVLTIKNVIILIISNKARHWSHCVSRVWCGGGGVEWARWSCVVCIQWTLALTATPDSQRRKQKII